jgi:hypothetical protein
LLEDPRAASAVEDFHIQLLDLDRLDDLNKDPQSFPTFTDTVRDAMAEEARRFVAHAVLQDDGAWSTLMDADYTFLNAELANYYGIVDGVGQQMQQVSLRAEHHRGGLLALGGLMAGLGKYATTSPVLRGKFVRERLLCQQLPPPPDNVDFEPPDVDPDATARERYREHSENPTCAGCHTLLDPIGFGFEHYDGAGKWRAVENGFPIDASGELVATEDIDGPFDGVEDLAARLGESVEARRCVAKQWFRYAYGREETEDDACSLELLQSEFLETGDVRALLVDLTQTHAFRYVEPKEGA